MLSEFLGVCQEFLLDLESGPVIAAVVDASVNFGSGADEIIDKAGTLVIDLLSAFSSEENRPMVAATAQGIIDSFAVNVLAISGQLVDTGLSLLDELLNGMADENAVKKLTDAANDMITQIKTGFTEHGDSIADAATPLITHPGSGCEYRRTCRHYPGTACRKFC